MSGCCQRSMIRCRRQRIVRERGRRRSSRVGRVWPRALGHTTRVVVVIIIVLIVRMRPRHVVCRKRRQVAPRAVHAMRVVRVVTGRRHVVFTLNLVSSVAENTHARVAPVVVSWAWEGVGGVRVRWRHVGRNQCRVGSRADGARSRRGTHHARVWGEVVVDRVVGGLAGLVASPRVWVVVYP